MIECSIAGCERAASTRGWCRSHYMRWWAYGDVKEDRPIGARRTRAPMAERFWTHVDRVPSGCWSWRGATNKTGYCYFKTDDGKARLAHRVAFELANGPIPNGLQIDHLCHNRDKTCRGGWSCAHRRCVNPQHLALATQSQNLRRGRCGDRVRERAAAITHCPHGHEYAVAGYYMQGTSRKCKACHAERMQARTLKGQGMPDPRRIDAAALGRVRELLAEGRSHSQIHAETGVSMATISRIRNGGSWFSPA